MPTVRNGRRGNKRTPEFARLKLASDCPNLDFASQSPIILDAMHEVIASREKSKFAKLLDENSHPGDCSAYNGVIDAIGLSLGRYYELA